MDRVCVIGFGRTHIYVQPFPGPGPRTRVSVDTGFHPQWRGDGAELFWEASAPRSPTEVSTLDSVDVAFSANSVRAAASRLVLPRHVSMSPLIDNRPHWAAAPDGQRFLLRQPDGLPGPAVKVIPKWKEQLRVP